jgi:hypothetical protein
LEGEEGYNNDSGNNNNNNNNNVFIYILSKLKGDGKIALKSKK